MITRLAALSLILVIPVSVATGFPDIAPLAGKYCGYTSLFGFTTISMSLDFDPAAFRANFLMVIDAVPHAFNSGVAYTLNDESRLTLETDNDSFNEFLAKFSIGLTPRSFDTTYVRSEDRLDSYILLPFAPRFKVVSDKAMCKQTDESGTYSATSGEVLLAIDAIAKTISVNKEGEKAPGLTPDGLLSYALKDDGSFGMTQEENEVRSYTLQQIPGVKQLLLQYSVSDGAQVSLVLVNREKYFGDEMVLL